MNKVLISWFGVFQDFSPENKIITNGPTSVIYKNFFDYDFHIILVPEEFVDLALEFKNYAEKNYNVFVILKPQTISYYENNYQVIYNVAQSILLELKNYKIDILVNTGSELMQVIWFFLYYSMNFLNIRLLKAFWNETKSRPEYINIDFYTSSVPITAVFHYKEILQKETAEPFLTDSFQKVYNLARKFALSENSPILIIGKTGTGRETLAKFIHKNSPTRSQRPFLVFDAALYPDQLFEFKLFGYKRGSFPGAVYDYKGLLVEANGGTLYIKNIDTLSVRNQYLLHKFLLNHTVEPVVGRSKKVNVRIIASVSSSIRKLISENKILLDLLYLFTARLFLPNFADLSMDEKKVIIDNFLDNIQKTLSVKQRLRLCKELWDFLFSYDFPGNLIELKSILESLYIINEDSEVCINHLPEYIIIEKQPESLSLEEVEKIHIEKVLRMFKGNKSRTARALGIALNTLKKKIRDYNINIEKLLQQEDSN